MFLVGDIMGIFDGISSIMSGIYSILKTPIPFGNGIYVSWWDLIVVSLLLGLFFWFVRNLFD